MGDSIPNDYQRGHRKTQGSKNRHTKTHVKRRLVQKYDHTRQGGRTDHSTSSHGRGVNATE